MATYAQRAQSLADALTNRATPQAQIVRLADAIAKLSLIDPATLTLVKKAELVVNHFRGAAISTIKQAENAEIAAAAVAGNSADIEGGLSEG